MPLAWILSNWQLIAKGIGVIALAGLLWFYFVHNPKVIKGLEVQIVVKDAQIKAAQEAINLYGNIRLGKEVLDDENKKKINDLKSVVFKPHSSYLFMPSSLPKAMSK